MLHDCNDDAWATNLWLALKARKKFGFADGSIAQLHENSANFKNWTVKYALFHYRKSSQYPTNHHGRKNSDYMLTTFRWTLLSSEFGRKFLKNEIWSEFGRKLVGKITQKIKKKRYGQKYLLEFGRKNVTLGLIPLVLTSG